MKGTRVMNLAMGAMLAALYVVLTLLSGMIGLSSGAIQIRISEALCIMPYFTSAAIPGLALGCLLSNLIVGGNPLDLIFGTLATLIGSIVAYLIRRRKYLTPLPTIIANALIVPFVLIYGYQIDLPYFYMFATVGIGEAISCGVLGELLLISLCKVPMFQRMALSNNGKIEW